MYFWTYYKLILIQQPTSHKCIARCIYTMHSHLLTISFQDVRTVRCLVPGLVLCNSAPCPRSRPTYSPAQSSQCMALRFQYTPEL